MKQQEFIQGKVSIVTPVYNGESHLAQMLDSVLSQTYSKVEMILADDGSTDNTVQVAESYRGKFIQKGYEYHIVKGNHKNASGAINYGLPYVTGEYLIWPDSDDVLEPESIERRVRFLEEHPEYQSVRSLSYYFDKEHGVLDRADEKTGDLTKEDLFWEILEFRTYVCCGCYMVRSEPFFKVYPRRQIPEYPVGQNFQMLLPFMYFHKCHTIPERLYGVFIREGSHSRTPLSQEENEKKYEYYEDLVDEIAEICKIKDTPSKQRILLWKMKRRYNIARQYGRKRKAAGALFQMCLCGRNGREMAMEYTEVWRKKYDLIQKLRSYWRIKKNRSDKQSVKNNMEHRKVSVKKPDWFLKGQTWLYWRFRRGYAILRNFWKGVYGWLLSKATWLYWRIRIQYKHLKLLCKKGRRKIMGKKNIALTFDDGYKNSAEILDKLKEHEVKATFFVCGVWIKSHMESFQQIFQEGHEIGNHSYSHPHMDELSDAEVDDEIEGMEELSQKITGERNSLFRFPYGRSNKHLIQLVKEKGFVPIGWSIDTRDWTGITAEEIFRNVMESESLKDGAVILMHTTGMHTVEALDLIIPALKERGYKMVMVSDL